MNNAQLHTSAFIMVFMLFVAVIGVGYLAVVDDFPEASITGLVFQKVDFNNPPQGLNGVYSVYPHFRATVPFDFSVYETIQPGILAIIACVDQGGTIDHCTKQQSTLEFEWSLSCEETDRSELFNMVANKLSSIINSPAETCYDEIEFRSFEYNGRYTFSLEQPEQRSLTMRQHTQEQSFHGPVFGNTFGDALEIEYSSGTFYSIVHTFDEDHYDSRGFADSSKLYVQKTTTADSALVELFHKRGSQYIKFTEQGEDTYEFNENTPRCPTKANLIQKFCVKTKTELPIFNLSDKRDIAVQYEPVTIRFAAHIPDAPPSPVPAVRVLDMPKNDDHVIVLWEAVDEDDVVKYTVYDAPASKNLILQNTPLSTIREQSNMLAVPIEQDEEDLDAFPDLTTCDWDRDENVCLFTVGTEKQELKPDIVYYSIPTQHYFVILKRTEELDATVIAHDAKDNTIDNIREGQKIPIGTGAPINDMAVYSGEIIPSLTNLKQNYNEQANGIVFDSYDSPTERIDGTTFLGTEDIFAYATTEHVTAATTLEKALERATKLPVTRVGDAGEFIIITEQLELSSGYDYTIIVAALNVVDDTHPEAKFTLEELGVTPLKFSSDEEEIPGEEQVE